MGLMTDATRVLFAVSALIVTTVLTQPSQFNASQITKSISIGEATAKNPSFSNFYVVRSSAKSELSKAHQNSALTPKTVGKILNRKATRSYETEVASNNSKVMRMAKAKANNFRFTGKSKLR